jgi:hypothetical protein
MSFSNRSQSDSSAAAIEAEKTLRLIAVLPAPQGIEERVKSRLRAAPRQASLLRWPLRADSGGSWIDGSLMRTAAAAAIVMVVAGGGWEVYTHIRVAPEPAAMKALQPVNGHSGLSTAGAMRTPQTLQGPSVLPTLAKQKAVNGAPASTVHVPKAAARKLRMPDPGRP